MPPACVSESDVVAMTIAANGQCYDECVKGKKTKEESDREKNKQEKLSLCVCVCVFCVCKRESL